MQEIVRYDKLERNDVVRGEGPICQDNFALEDHDVNDRAIEHQEVSRDNQGEPNQDGIGNSLPTNQNPNSCDNSPWTAPRVVAQYLGLSVNIERPTGWTIDDHDGQVSWEEGKQFPKLEYQDDVEMNTNQYHRFGKELYQHEATT